MPDISTTVFLLFLEEKMGPPGLEPGTNGL